jgi:hypothetical protein
MHSGMVNWRAMKSFALLVFMAVAVIPASAQGVRLSADFFPLAVGNRWVYTIAAEDGKKIAESNVAVEDHRIIGGRSFYVLTDFPFVADSKEKIRLIGYDRQEREFIRIVNDKEGPLFLADGATVDTIEQDAAGLPSKIRLKLDTMTLILQRGVGIIDARIQTDAGLRGVTMTTSRVGEPRAANGTPPAPATPAPPPNSTSRSGGSLVSTVNAENPQLTLAVTPSTAGIQMTLTVTNTADRLLPFRFLSGQNYDFAVLDSAGKEVWRWSKKQYFTTVTRSEALRPQSAWKYEAVWDHRDNEGNAVPAGEYRIVGRLTSEPALESPAAPLTIP